MKMVKIKSLINLLFVPGSLWKANNILKEERPSPTTIREKELQKEIDVYGDASILCFEMFRGGVYFAVPTIILLDYFIK